MLPHLDHEIKLWQKGYTVIGMDEVGRGAFAGPLCVAGVIFNPCHDDNSAIKSLLDLKINDSKKLSKNRRQTLSEIIQKLCFSYFISTIEVAEINTFGVANATFSAMRGVVKKAREKLPQSKIYLLTDAFELKDTPGINTSNQLNIIHGDTISLSIAAASIIAKVYRDNLMDKLSEDFPLYDWHINKGYGTKSHREALLKYGVTKLHRTQFIRNYIAS